ncbi:MAG: nitrogen fixation protein NifH [Chloroflexota bacterium]
MSWKNQLRSDSLPWLLESENPAIRYLAMRDLLDLPAGDKKLTAARRLAHKEGPIAHVLSKMNEEGWWGRPGTGYGPKYKSTVWALILLAQLGAAVKEDKRIKLACKYYLDEALNPGGQISAMTNKAPSGTIDCLQGNILWSLMDLGYEDKRMDAAYEWMARTVTGEGIAPMKDKKAEVRYFAGKYGPNFACGANNKLPCAWGGVKVMLALSRLPVEKRSELVQRAVSAGVEFFFAVDPSAADYPNGYAEKPSGNWWKFGFPVFYISDILQIAEALVALGFGKDPRLANTLELIRSKQDAEGRWPLEYNYDGKTWMRFGRMKEPNPWVTLRALRVLKAAG